MSASNEWTEWHITPRGWEEGTCKTDTALNEVTPPEDRVLTMKYCEFLSSRFSKADIGAEELWRGSDSSTTQSLLAQFGPCPNHL
jgi:hypothetical protein